jgi:hypothetical protein
LSASLLRADADNPGRFELDLSWVAGPNAATELIGYTVRYKQTKNADGTPFVGTDGLPDIWRTYVNGRSQDFQGTSANPSLTIKNLAEGDYDFEVVEVELTLAPSELKNGKLHSQHVTLEGGLGNDVVAGFRYTVPLFGAQGGNLFLDGGDSLTDPIIWNNPLAPLPLGFIATPPPGGNQVARPREFAAYLNGGGGNDFVDGGLVNQGLGQDYTYMGVEFKGLNTLVGGQGSDTFVVRNGGKALGDSFDWIVKYGNETPVNFGSGGVGNSLNGGMHNLVVSLVDFLTLSDTVVSQGKFIDQIHVPRGRAFAMGNSLENYIIENSMGTSSFNTLVGGAARDSLVGNRKGNLLVGGNAYGMDNVGMAIKDFAPVFSGGNGLEYSIFRDTDPIPTMPNGPAAADPSQFWFVPGYYGAAYDPNSNRDTLVAGAVNTTLDGGAGADSLWGSGEGDEDDRAARSGDTFIVSRGAGGRLFSQDIRYGDAVIGNGGNDTVVFTDSDYLWWGTPQNDGITRIPHVEGGALAMNGYTIGPDISNLVLQMGAPTARNATGNSNSTGNDHAGGFTEVGSNRIVGNEFDNIIDGSGVGGNNNEGSGFDTLTGNGGSDLFVVSGYTKSTDNQWNPRYNNSGVWQPNDSTYTDADFVLITDFTAEDILSFGNTANFWIGGTPVGFNSENLNNFVRNGVVPTATSFGIYTANNSTPNLVAQVNLVGGLELDIANIGSWTQQNPNGDGSRGIYYEIAGVNFLDGGVGGTPIAATDLFDRTQYAQQASTASLSALMGQIV